MRIACVVLFVVGCGPSVTFYGQPRTPHVGVAIDVYEHAPPEPHTVIGWLVTDGDMTLDEHLRVARAEARRRGCDALIWNPNHRLVDGVRSEDQTGIFASSGRYAVVFGARAACIVWP